jgi:hypothetical protein
MEDGHQLEAEPKFEVPRIYTLIREGASTNEVSQQIYADLYGGLKTTLVLVSSDKSI